MAIAPTLGYGMIPDSKELNHARVIANHIAQPQTAGHIKPELDQREPIFDFEVNQCAGISEDSIDIFQKRLIEQKEIKIKLNDIIEWNLSGNNQLFIDSLNGKETEINQTRKAMAQKWVRNASTRIFSDLNRSFLEIVVNAFDAMLPEEESVGKFGMGFFSILSLLDLKETDGTIIQINTTAKDKGGKLFSYSMTIEKDSAKDIHITFKLIKPASVTGTKISILPKNASKSFSQETIDALYKYLHYLQFYKKGRIDLVIERNKKLVNEKLCLSSGNIISQVKLVSRELSVEDKGTGISLGSSLTKLLVPSSSSKAKKVIALEDIKAHEINNTSKPQLVTFLGKTKENLKCSHFLIEINGVIVIIIPNKQTELENQIIGPDGTVKDLLISMPQITQLTLARNEIYINPNESSFEEKYLKRIIENTINNITLITDKTDQKTLVENQLLISALYNGFNYWEKQTAAEHVNGLFTTYIKAVLAKLLENKKNIFPIHPLFYSLVKNVCDKSLKTKNQDCILLPIDASIVSYSYAKLENFLKAQFLSIAHQIPNSSQNQKSLFMKGVNQELIAGKIVLFVPDDVLKGAGNAKPKITDAGLRQTLFVPMSFLNENQTQDALVNKIISYFTETILNSYHKNPDQNYQKFFLINSSEKSIKGALPNPMITLLNSGDIQLANEFITKNKNLIKGLILKDGRAGYYDNDFIQCYDKSCQKSGCFHHRLYNNFSMTGGFCTDPQIMTIDNLALLFSQSLEAIQNICNGQRDRALTGPFGHNEFPAHLLKLLKEIIIFDEETNKFFMFDYDKITQLFINEFKTNQIIQKISKNEIPRRYSNDAFTVAQKIKPLLQQLIKENSLLKLPEVNPVDVVNSIFAHLIIRNKLVPEDFILEYNANLEIFPKLEKNYVTLENLFLSLVSRDNYYTHDYHNFVKPILSQNISVRSRDLNKQMLQKVIAEKLEEIPMSFEYQNTLSNSVQNLNIPACLIDSLVVYMNMRDASQLTSESKKTYSEFRNSMLSLYKNYFKLQDNDIAYNYGYHTEIQAVHPQNDVNSKELIDLLQKCALYPTLYNKLLEFQIIDFIFQTNRILKSQDISNKKLYVPSLFANTPISALAYLLKIGVHENIIKIIIEYSRNSAELMYIAYLISSVNQNPGIRISLSRENKEIEDNLKIIIKTLIQEKVDQDRIISIYNENRPKDSIDERTKTLINEPITQNIKNYLLDIANNRVGFAKKTSFVAAQLKLPQTKTFTLKQLINAHCTGTGLSELLHSNDSKINMTPAQLNTIIEHINQQEKNLEFGKIEQSVEAGSEKSPVCGTITECLQNSVDSIKQFMNGIEQNKNEVQKSLQLRGSDKDKVLNNLSTLSFSLATMDSKVNNTFNHLSLTIRDHVGFSSFKSLITDFLLPDYSNKRPDLGNVGDMGNGSFKIYQQAEFVSIITRPIQDPEKVYMLAIVPLRNNVTKRVDDLSITIRDISDQVPQDLFGTTIRVVFLPEAKSRNDINLIYVKDFLNNTVGATDISLPFAKKLKIILQNQEEVMLLNKPLMPVFQTFDSNNNVKFAVNQRENSYLQSFITTGGVPFRTVSSLCKQMNLLPVNFINDLSFGYVVNLDINTYEPVQSRTLLQMNKENQIGLKQTLLDAYYIIGLRKGANNSNYLEKIFTHFGSVSSSLEQVSLSSQLNKNFNGMLANFLDSNAITTMEPELFFTYFKPSWAKKSFYQYIQEAYDALLKDMNKKIQENDRIISEWHAKNQSKLQIIATSDNKDLVVKLTKELNAEFEPIRKKCATEIAIIFANWRNGFKKSEDELCNLVESQVVIPWVFKKVEGIIDRFKHAPIEIPYENKDSGSSVRKEHTVSIDSYYMPTIKLFNELMQYSLTSYCDLFFKKIGTNNIKDKFTGSLFYFNPYQPALGFYSPTNKKIAINLAGISIADYFEMLTKILSNDATGVRLSSTYNKLFANLPGSDATVTHELEHARRGDNHDGCHGPELDADGNISNYRTCANSFSKKAQEAGLINDWIKDVINFFNNKVGKNNFSYYISRIQYCLSDIRKIESTSKISLVQELGYVSKAKL
jgi:hypothetical protein